MFKESYYKIKKIKKEIKKFAKESETFLYPLIDKAIQEEKSIDITLALIASLPVEKSRFKYIEILSNNNIINHNSDYFMLDFFNDEYYKLKENYDEAMKEHLSLVLEEFNNKSSNNEELINNEYITDTAKIIINNRINQSRT